MNKNIFLIVLLTAAALIVSAPKNYPVHFTLSLPNGFKKDINFTVSSPTINITKPFAFQRDLNIRQGLDLQGGTEVVLRADMKDVPADSRKDALDSAKEVITRRVDLYGVSEPVIKTLVNGDDYRISVSLPGVSNTQEALDLIGQTASLDFREIPIATDSPTFADFVPTGLTGKDLKKSTVQFDNQTGKPVVGLQFNEEGAQKFADITGRNVGKPLGIFLDGYPITNPPTVQQKIEGGQAVINGEFAVEEAKNLSITLNAGALPVPIQILSQNNVTASLGQASIQKSLRAGAVGLGAVALFMILLYGWMGFVAVIGLMIYGLITLAIYKLIPVILTLPGLAGFILSIGMAVDANILIFERMKEELRKGHEWAKAMELGFGRAWDSIKDANVATLITTFVLFNPLDWSFLNSSGMIRGFALTLFLGVVIGLFTGIFVTRNLLRVFMSKPRGVKKFGTSK